MEVVKRLVKAQLTPSAEQFVVVRAEVAVGRALAVCDDDGRPVEGAVP